MSNLRPIRLFPKLYDIEEFINQSHPVYVPDTPEYDQYWEVQEKRCLEGMWGFDYDKKKSKGGWRYITPHLYYYINFTQIEDTPPGGSPIMINPLLRDVDWIISYGWLAAKGFSGFENDNKYTCSRIVQKIENGHPLSPKEKYILKKIKPNLLNKYGKYKKYVDAKAYLYSVHKMPKGRPLYDNENLNFFLIGSRGFGKSYFTSNGIIGHTYNFFGKRYYDDEYLFDPKGSDIFVGSANSDKSSDLLEKFEFTQEKFHKTGPGSYRGDMVFIPGYFYVNSEGSLKPNNGENQYQHSFEYLDKEVWLKGGSQARIKHGVFTKFNPQAAVGGRYSDVVVEEVGLAEDIVTIHGANETTQIRQGYKFGSSIYIGTGGNVKKIQGSRTIFYDPEGFNMVMYDDVFERTGPIGCFMPAYLVDSIWKDEHGNTDYKNAFKEEMNVRETKKRSSDDAAYTEYAMSRPIVPSEMFMNEDLTKWPADLARRRAIKLISGKIFDKVAKCVTFEKTVTRTKVTSISKTKNPPITKYRGSSRFKRKGSICIYEHPGENLPPASYTNSIYKTVYDPVKKDDLGPSFSSIVVYKSFTELVPGLQNTIVADYIGRLNSLDKTHQIAIDLANYYNSKVLFENNFNDFWRYCQKTNNISILQPALHLITQQKLYKSNGELNYGVTMSDSLRAVADQHGYEWLMEPRKSNIDGEVTKFTMDYIFAPRFLEEMINWEPKKNFDYISAMRILWLWLAQERVMPMKQREKEQRNIKADKMTAMIPTHIREQLKQNKNGTKRYSGHVPTFNGERGDRVLQDVHSMESEESERLQVLRDNGRTPGLDYWL